MNHEHVMKLISLAALVVAGCSGGSPTQPGAPTGAAVDGEPPAGAPSAQMSAWSAQPAASALAPAEIESELVAVSELPYPIDLHTLGPTLLGVGRTYEEDVQGVPMGIIQEGRFIPKKELTFPVVMGLIVGLAGTWPRGVDMVATGTTGRTAIAMHFTLSADVGWRANSSRDGSFFTGIAEIDGSTVALETPALFPTFKPEIKTLRGPKLVRTTAPLDKACARQLLAEGQPPDWLPRTDLTPEALGSTRGGTLISVGTRACAGGAVEIWEPKSTTSRIVALPAAAEEKQGGASIITGAGENDAYVIGGRGAWYYDGKGLTALPEPPSAITQAAMAKGTLYALTEAENRFDDKKKAWVVVTPARLFKLDGKAWTEVPLPTSPDDIAVDQEGTLWVSTGTTLLRTRKSANEKSQIAVAKKADDTSILSPRARRVRAAGPLCPSNLVVLYGFTKVTPADYDFPLTRKALKGHTEYDKTRFVVANDGGQKFFSAIVPDVATGRKLVSLIEKEVKGSKPQLLCAEPEIVREVKLNLKTGEVVK